MRLPALLSTTPRAPRRTLGQRVMAGVATVVTGLLLASGLPLAAGAAAVPGVAPQALAATATAAPQSIVVTVGAERTSDGVAGIAGVVLELHQSTADSPDSAGAKVDQPWATCTSVADGTCTFTVPDVGTSNAKGANYGKRFWVTEVAAPSGYYLNPTMITGDNTNDGSQRFAQTPYTYRTVPLTGTGPIQLPSMAGMPAQSSIGAPLSATGPTNDRWKTGGVLPVSQANNRYQATCTPGLKVGILIDLSTSMSHDNNAGINGAKTAAKTLIQSLIGTGTQVSLYAFSTNAPKNNTATGKNYPTPVTVTASSAGTSAQFSNNGAAAANTLYGQINGYSASDDNNYTNWDRGLLQLAQADGAFDVAIVLTDGNPTVFGANPTLQGWTTHQHVEESIFSANALKSRGTQVLAFGVGAGIATVTGDNLRAVSGEKEWTGSGSIMDYDYTKTSDWSLVASELESLAAGLTCAVPIKVVKTEKLLDGSTRKGAGWTFGATVSAGSGTLSTPAAQVTPTSGAVSWNLGFTEASQSGSVTISETGRTGWQLASVVCTNNGTEIVNGTSASFTLDNLEVGDNVVCQVTNEQQKASVKVDKTWIVNGVSYADGSQLPSSLTAQLVLAGSNQAWGATRSGINVGSTVTIKENLGAGIPALCTVDSQNLTLSGSSTVLKNLADGTYTTPALAGGLTSYQLTNVVTCAIAKPTITKTVTSSTQNPDGTWTTVYAVTVKNNDADQSITYDLADTLAFGGSITKTATATGPSAQVSAWNGVSNTVLATQQSLAATASDVYTVTAIATVPNGAATSVTDCPTATTGNGGFMNRAVLTVDGTDYPAQACAAPAKPSITKDAGTVTANADGTWTVTYGITVKNSSATNLYYDLSDDPQSGFPAGVTVASGTVTPAAAYTGYTSSWNPVTGGSKNAAIVAGLTLPASTTHSYTVSLVLSVAPTVPAAALDCTVPGKGLINTATLVSGKQVLTDDACDTITPPAVAHTKKVTSLVQNTDGSWTTVYEVKVTATGTGVATYSLTDSPKFGAGITISSATASGPAQAGSWDGAANSALATNAVIAGGSSDTYVVTIVANVAAKVTGTTAADCTIVSPETGTGFLNLATLTANGSTTTRDACGSPVAPTLQKNWVSTTQNADTSWNVTFEVDAANPSTTTGLVYSLTDTPAFLAGVTVTGRTVALNGAAAAAWDGSSALATDRSLAAGATDKYVLVFTVTVPLGLDPAVLDCTVAGAGHGYFNGATLTSGADTITDDACGPVTEGVLPLIEKSVTSGFPRQIAGGDWEISYDVTVSTPTGNTLAAKYDLTDTLQFGKGITVVAAAVSGPGTVNADWDGASDVTVASDVTLPAGASHVYTVLVTARLDAGVVLTTDADCTVDKGEKGTGFLNAAQLTSGSLTRDAEACASPAAPTITKDLVGSPVKGKDGKVTITYKVTAANPSALQLNYDLDDKLGFASGVTINSAAVQSSDATVNPAWNGQGTTRVVTGQSLPGGESDVYTVTVLATPTLFVNQANQACVTATSGKGYFNGAILTSGADTYRDDACAPIPKTDLPTLSLTDLPTLAFTGGGAANLWGLGGGALLLLFGALAMLVGRQRRPRRH